MKGTRRQQSALVLTTIALALSGSLAGAVTPDPVPTLVTAGVVSQFPAPPIVRHFAVYDAAGKLTRTAAWRVTAAGGNCCEDYVVAEPGGRLITFGGTYPMYSDDQGLTWYEVKPATLLNNGEGAVVAGPDGDIAGIGWDAYSGDHLQSFHYDPATRQWSVGEVPLKEPFFDRPWITIARGPWTIDGHTYPYVWLVHGGGTDIKDPELLSVDGLHYSDLSSPAFDEMSAASGKLSITKGRNDLADYWSPHPWAGTVPLSGGGLLQMTQPNDGDLATCAVSQLQQASGAWQCVPFSPPGIASWTTTTQVCCQLRQDSRGWLSDVVAPAEGKNKTVSKLQYYLSVDAGRHWSKAATLRPPRGGTLEGDNLYNYVVNGRLGIAAISARFDDANSLGQDMVFVVDVSHPQPKLLYTMILGLGDLQTANDVSGAERDRFDYASVAILPTGAIAASFDDSTTRLDPETLDTQAGQLARDQVNSSFVGHNSPNLAILLGSAILPPTRVLGEHKAPAPATRRSGGTLPATGTGDEAPFGLILISLAVALAARLGGRRRHLSP